MSATPPGEPSADLLEAVARFAAVVSAWVTESRALLKELVAAVDRLDERASELEAHRVRAVAGLAALTERVEQLEAERV